MDAEIDALGKIVPLLEAVEDVGARRRIVQYLQTRYSPVSKSRMEDALRDEILRRLANGEKQSAIAEDLDTSQATVSRIKNGE